MTLLVRPLPRLFTLLAVGLVLAAAWLAQAPGRVAHAAQTSADAIVSGAGDAAGYHLYLATARSGWAWTPLATIAPDPDGSWVGQQCLTGDGRFAVAVIAPRLGAGAAAAIVDGGLAYAVEVSTGRVRPLLDGVSLAYFDPACGTGSTAAFTGYLDASESRTRVTTMNVATGARLVDATVSGQLTSAVPVSGGAIAVRDSDLVRIDSSGRVTSAAHADGLPFEVRPTAGGGADFLVAPAGAAPDATARLWQLRGTTARPVASGPLATLHLFLGRGGRNTVAGATGTTSAQRTLTLPGRAVQGASLDGEVALAAATGTAAQQPTGTAKASVARPAGVLVRSDTTADVPFALVPHRTPTVRKRPTHTPPPGLAPADATTPACAVPRNDPALQAPQPNAARVDWAIQQGVRNLLTGANGRPAGYLNLGLPAYSPDADFPAPTLLGGGTIPAQVVEGVFVAESNWSQASPHAPAGTAGNPLIANYYGTDASLSTIDYSQADCGYGLGQVTDFMTAADTSQPRSIKSKVAVDYAENAAAAITVLATKWNQLFSAGITIGGGSAATLESWYFAIWAYNTGVHPNLGDGSPWGLGWVNNPINPTYPPNRPPFLRTSLDDARTPHNWPYQEQVFGWMETPLWNANGSPMFTGVASHYGTFLGLPSHSAFCSTSRNSCSPTRSQPCTRADLECWWHSAVASWCGSGCHAAYFTVGTGQTEPASANPHPPVCSLDASFPAGTVVVATEPADLNVVGCPDPPANWSNAGTYTAAFGLNGSGQPTGVIDYHQIGGGFGGHFLFTHTEPGSDEASQVSVTWAPPGSVTGTYEIRAFVPDLGATTMDAAYEIDPGSGGSPELAPLNQNAYSNQWVSLGRHHLNAGARVLLSNVTDDGAGVDDIAFGAIAFVPVA